MEMKTSIKHIDMVYLYCCSSCHRNGFLSWASYFYSGNLRGRGEGRMEQDDV
jgi:hypothetical protein